jgi:hypothetical protein
MTEQHTTVPRTTGRGAAPDLLEVVEMAVRLAAEMGDHSRARRGKKWTTADHSHVQQKTSAIIERGRTAIAKATTA